MYVLHSYIGKRTYTLTSNIEVYSYPRRYHSRTDKKKTEMIRLLSYIVIECCSRSEKTNEIFHIIVLRITVYI